MSEQLIQYIKTLVPLSDIKKEKNQQELFKNILLGKMPAGKTLYQTAARSEFTYYLLAGELTLIDENDNKSVLNAEDPRCRFPVGYDQSHKYTVKTNTEISYLKINSETLDVLLTWDQVTTPLLRRPAKQDDENQTNWMARILELELFHHIPPVNIQAMFLRFETVAVEQDEIVIEQGSPGDFYYVIKSGRCAIYRSDEDSEDIQQHKLAELGPGDSFGEEALVSDSPRNATVIMREAGELARLSKENFIALLKDPVMKSVDYEQAQALVEQGARFIDARTENEYQHNHLANSLNLPLDSLRTALIDLDKSPEYIVYCDSGSRSSAACYILNQHGFDAYLLENGLNGVPSDAIMHPD